MNFKLWLENWTRESAEEYLRQIAPLMEKGGYGQLKIVGGVSEHGKSSHDLDVVAIQTRFRNAEDFGDEEGRGGPLDFLGQGEWYNGPGAESCDETVYTVHLPDGRIVDFFLTDPYGFGHE